MLCETVYPYGTTIRVWYRKTYRTRMARTVRIRYVPYAYGMKYAYGTQQHNHATAGVFHYRDFILFATLLTSLLTAFIPSHGTTFDSGLDGLGKVDSLLKYTSESGSITTYVYYVLNATWHSLQ